MGAIAKMQSLASEKAVQKSNFKTAEEKAKAEKAVMITKSAIKMAADKDAQKRNAIVGEKWASYLKAFADQKSEDAKAKKKTDLTPWNKALAAAARSQKGDGGVDCTSIGKKFQSLVFQARDESKAEAKKS